VLRSHGRTDAFGGPRFLVRVAGLEMHPMDSLNRTKYLKETAGIGFCNITKCCTEVCPEEITITDNAIIPLKERVVDDHYDPIRMLIRLVTGKKGA
jgi:succinate dehydrogenase / fumarate reductase iron-sulfur subunit